MEAPDADELAALVDKQAIAEVVLRYCRGIDRLDMELVRSCYHPGGIDHHTGFEGDRDAYVLWVEPLLRRLTSSMHMVGNQLIELDGDLARSETYGTAFHLAIAPGESFTTGFRYVDRFERRDGRSPVRRAAAASPRDGRGAGAGVAPDARSDLMRAVISFWTL